MSQAHMLQWIVSFIARWLFIGGLVIWYFRDPLRRCLYRYLDVSHPPTSTQMIVVLGGQRQRAVTAAQLCAEKLAPKILVGGNPLDIKHNLEELEKCQVPVDDVIVMAPTYSTWDEAQVTCDYLRESLITSILVVTTRMHSGGHWRFITL